VTGQYTEWLKAAEGASDFWQRQKKNVQDYQADIKRIIESDPLNDFFARNRSQMGYYTAPAGKIYRQMAQDAAKAVKDAEEAAKKAAAEMERSQKAVADAVADAQKKVWDGLAKELDQNNEAVRFRLREYRADLEKIRELGKKAYEEAGEDIHQRHREMIGPYDADQVKKNLEEIKNQEKEASDWSVELSKYTLETIQDQFAGFFDDLQEGEFKSFGDYVIGFFKSLGKAVNRIVANGSPRSCSVNRGRRNVRRGFGLAQDRGHVLDRRAAAEATPSGWANAYQHHSGGIAGQGAVPPAWSRPLPLRTPAPPRRPGSRRGRRHFKTRRGRLHTGADEGPRRPQPFDQRAGLRQRHRIRLRRAPAVLPMRDEMESAARRVLREEMR